MESAITIDGTTVPGSVYVIRDAYETISAQIDSGEPSDFTFMEDRGDFRIRHVFRIGPTTTVNAVLAFDPTDDIPERYDAR